MKLRTYMKNSDLICTFAQNFNQHGQEFCKILSSVKLRVRKGKGKEMLLGGHLEVVNCGHLLPDILH